MVVTVMVMVVTVMVVTVTAVMDVMDVVGIDEDIDVGKNMKTNLVLAKLGLTKTA
jgi:hypothetical protein